MPCTFVSFRTRPTCAPYVSGVLPEFVPGEREEQMEFHVLKVGLVKLTRRSSIITCDACAGVIPSSTSVVSL